MSGARKLWSFLSQRSVCKLPPTSVWAPGSPHRAWIAAVQVAHTGRGSQRKLVRPVAPRGRFLQRRGEAKDGIPSTADASTDAPRSEVPSTLMAGGPDRTKYKVHYPSAAHGTRPRRSGATAGPATLTPAVPRAPFATGRGVRPWHRCCGYMHARSAALAAPKRSCQHAPTSRRKSPAARTSWKTPLQFRAACVCARVRGLVSSDARAPAQRAQRASLLDVRAQLLPPASLPTPFLAASERLGLVCYTTAPADCGAQYGLTHGIPRKTLDGALRIPRDNPV